MKLLITRHGETYDNLDNILTGQKDVQLTEKGMEDAKNLVKNLKKFDIDIIYCSSLQRARDTIAPYLKQKNVNVIYTDELKEMDLGTYNGSKPEEAGEERGKGLHHKVGGGESLSDLYSRADSFLKEIKKKHMKDSVLLVGHNAINRNIIGIIKGYSIEEINNKKERYPNADILAFDIS